MTPNEERSEDLRWMAAHYETPKEAARRLGISVGGLEAWCRRVDPEVYAQLLANDRRRRGVLT